MIRKFFFRTADGQGNALEADPKIVKVEEVNMAIGVGDTVDVLYRGTVVRVYGDEVEIQHLVPVEIIRAIKA